MSEKDLLSPENSPVVSGVRRLNKLPLFIIGVVIMAVLFGLMYALNARKPQQQEQASSVKGNKTIEKSAMAESLTKGIRDGVVPTAKQNKIDKQEVLIQSDNKSFDFLPPQPLNFKEKDHVDDIVKTFREQKYYDAVVAKTPVKEGVIQARQENQTLPKQPVENLTNQPTSTSELILKHLNNTLGSNKAQHIEFGKTTSEYDYLDSARRQQLTAYELRVGTIIPAVMVSGINSDLPGNIIAQVSHDVRDTKTGRFVLIPQGSKLIGKYDSQTKMGQKRVMIAWHRLQFPDSSSFNLGNMGAVDLSGYSGMKDKVNNHSFSLFKNAFLLTVIGAGSQMLIEDDGDENSSSRIAKNELGKQFGQLGAEMIRQNMNIKPTIEIRAGYRFNVFVNKDLILTPYSEIK